MKHKFSCLMILLAVFLFGTSGVIEAMSFLGKVVAKSGDEISVAGMKTLLNGSDDVLLKTLRTAGLSGTDDLLRSLVRQMDSALDDLGKAAAKEGGQNVDEALKGIQKTARSLENVGVKFAGVTDEVFTKLGGFADDIGKMSIGDFNKLIDGMIPDGNISKIKAGQLKQGFASSKTISQRAVAVGNDLMATSKSLFGKGVKKVTTSELDDAAMLSLEKKIAAGGEEAFYATKQLKQMKYEAAGPLGKMRIVSKAGVKRAIPLFGYAGATISAAILFMIPSIFQSAFLAQQQKNVLLQTYIPPIKFGNVVMQLPDSVINVENAMSSQFVYYGIPVENPGDGISAQAKAAYPGVSGPTQKNKVSEKVKNDYAKAFSLGGAKDINIRRYNLNAAALATLPIYVSYSEQSWLEWASNGIPDAAFSQTMINLNTGQILYADGTSQTTAPLIGPATNGKTVESFLKTKYGLLKSAGSQVTYKEYESAYDGARAGGVDPVIANQFNCACLTSNSGVLSEDTIKKCSADKTSSCLLTGVLNQLSAGLVINSQGKVMTPDQDLATEISKGALGQVIPIQGLGDKFDDTLRLFPGAEQDAVANSGLLTISLGSDLSSATPLEIQGAQPDNYTAKGVYVYQCKNTPLAKILKSQSGGSATASYNDLITDYIVFLDQDLNQVPMMAPVSNPKNFNFPTMGLNPAIKYVSTVIGNFDGDGSFNFLPQLNIQSPAALVAKGLPASFPPLYGLAAQNGSLAVNYNQNLSSTIGGIAQALLGHAKLGQQFKHMQSAMLRLLAAGPFGKYKLSPVDKSMQPNIGGVNLVLYTGFNGYPVSQDAANAACSDVLIPISVQGKTVTLPSNNVAQYYGLVTDLTYSVRSDGTIAVDSAGFANSPFSSSWAINQSKVSQFYWIDKLTGMGQGSDPEFVMPEALVNFVKNARSAWITWIKSISSSSIKQEFAGIKVPGTSTVVTIASQQALLNGLYIYTCSPSPSTVAQDYFILTNSSSPQVSDAALGSMSAASATAATNMLSVISGLLYNSSGVQVKNSSGVGYSVNAADLLKALNRTKPNAFSNDLKVKLNIASSQSAAAGESINYPFQFGNLQLGIYKADADKGVYLYIDAAGAGTSADFKPTDYLVTIDSYTNPTIAGTKLSSSTNFVVSLVSGQVYGPMGAQAFMDADQLSDIVGSLAPTWRSGVKGQIEMLTANFGAEQQYQDEQSSQMDAVKPETNSVILDRNSVVKTIAALKSQNYLPRPYDMLKQDPSSGMYVLVSPANVEGTDFMYTFLDVPNNFVDAQGKSMRVGAMYDGQGNLIRAVQGAELVSMLQQYGVAVDGAGKQSLGANGVVPVMPLDPADVALRPGVSGKSMIYSNDANFPSHSIVSPVVFQDSQFHFYYNTIAKAYYVMEVQGSSIRYIDLAGGNIYNLNGSAQIAANPVAFNSNGDANDMFLPYLNANSFIECVMKNKGNNNVYDSFMSLESSFEPFVTDPATNNLSASNMLVSNGEQSNTVNVFQMPFPEGLTDMPDISVANQYNVYFDESGTAEMYMVNAAAYWQDLQLLPINMNSRAVLNPMPAENFAGARLIFKNNALSSVIFANQLFSGASSAGQNSYNLTSGANKVNVSFKVDAKTNVKYVEVVAGSTTYNYQYIFKTMPESEFQNYQNNVWQVQTIADVTGKVLLEKYLPIDSSGNLQLSAVSMQNVVELPLDPSAKSALSSNLGNIVQDSASNRFLSMVDSSMFSYFQQNGYVDLENGTLFDETGFAVGYTLRIADLMKLLDQLTVTVVRNASNKAALRYRTPMASVSYSSLLEEEFSEEAVPYLPQMSVSQGAPTSYTPPAQNYNASGQSSYSAAPTYAQVAAPMSKSVAPVYNPATKTTTTAQAVIVPAVNMVPVQNKPAVKAASGSVQNAAQASSVMVTYSDNPQVAKLQQKNMSLQSDTKRRQLELKVETNAHRKEVLNNAIKTNSQQIAANEKQIASLSGAVQSRSTLLGRLSSKLFKSKK